MTSSSVVLTAMQREFNSENYELFQGLGYQSYDSSNASPYGKIIENTYYWYSTSANWQFNLEGKEYTYVAF